MGRHLVVLKVVYGCCVRTVPARASCKAQCRARARCHHKVVAHRRDVLHPDFFDTNSALETHVVDLVAHREMEDKGR